MNLLSDLEFEYLAELHLMVSCQAHETPTDADWDTYLEATRPALLVDKLFRVLVVTDGAYPTRSQQGRMTTLIGNRTPCVAVISSSTAMRFVVSILALLNSKVRCFSPNQRKEAYTYLGLSPSQQATADATVDRLRRFIGTESAKVA